MVITALCSAVPAPTDFTTDTLHLGTSRNSLCSDRALWTVFNIAVCLEVGGHLLVSNISTPKSWMLNGTTLKTDNSTAHTFSSLGTPYFLNIVYAVRFGAPSHFRIHININVLFKL
jgi:hypothetical protein